MTLLDRADLPGSTRPALPVALSKEILKIKNYYSREEYDLISMTQHQQLYELQKKARLSKGKKTPESGRALEVEWPY